MDRRGWWPVLAIAAVAALVWLTGVTPVHRLAIVALGGWILIDKCRHHGGAGLLSPALWLGLLAAWLFGLAPTIGLAFPEQTDMAPIWQDRVGAMLGGGGDRLVLGAALIFLAADSMLVRGGYDIRPTPLPGGYRLLLEISCLSLSGLFLLPVSSGGDIVSLHHNLAPPLVALGLVLLVRDADHGRRVLVVASLCLTAMLMAKMGKIPVAIGFAAALVFLVSRAASPRRWALAGLAGIVTLAAAITSVGLLRYGPSADNSMLWRAVPSKLIMRQSETMFCLDNVVKSHADGRAEGSTSDLLMGIVPRYLWPDKPSLSHGDRYAIAYCGYGGVAGIVSVVGSSVHSASITLVGQPLIKTGSLPATLIILSALAIVLAAATTVCLRHGGMATTVWAALLPWTMDFDQDMGLYLALGLKNLLIMAVAALALVWLQRRLPAVPGA